MFKKKISLVASFAMLTLTTAVVSGCGIPLDVIAARATNPDVYRTFFNFPLTSWSSGVTNRAEDNKILADLVGTLVATDKYNRSYGDIAVQEDKSSHLVGKPNANFTQWTYKISPDAKWFNHEGKIMRQIKASDMINTAKYVIYPKNLSQTGALWLSFIVGAQDIRNYFQDDAISKPEIPYYNNPIWEKKLGISINDKNDEVTFHLVKGAHYFDTLMTYLAFAPMPEIALTSGYNYGTKYSNIWYSGAYLVEQYNSSSRILLRKNEFYRFAKLAYVNKIDYTFFNNVDISRARLLFESGDLSEFIVSSSDSSGWNKYIGSDVNNPKFGGATKYPNANVGTFKLTYNYSNTNIFDGKDSATKQQALAASKALQYEKVRKFLALNLDRNKFVRFYSEALDTNNTSTFLRNVFTARDFIYKENEGSANKDYASYVEEEYANTYLDGDITKAHALLKDGSDAFYQNTDLMQNNSNLTGEIRKWLQENLGQSNVTLKILMNGALSLTSNKKLLDMIDSFNSSNDIIKIVPDITTDGTEYQKRGTINDYDLMVTGWSPDFADPFTFLNIYTLRGDIENYFGTDRIFSDLSFDSDGLAPAFETLNLNNRYWNLLKENPAMKNFYDMFKNYTNQVKKSDHLTKPSQLEKRYQGFAKAEFKVLYQDFMFLPLYVPEGTFRMYVSYVLPRTRVTAGYGSSTYKHWGMKMGRFLLTKKQVLVLEAKYQQDLEIIKKDYGAFREGY